MEYSTLNNGVKIPKLGMGGWAQSKANILDALDSGYTLIDTASQYGNEEAVGDAIRESGVPRSDIFVCTKLWTDDIRNRCTRKAFHASLSKLGLDYIDMYLIHWPADGFEEAYSEMEKLYKEGYVRAIGVSNFEPHHLDELMEYGNSITPAVNQVEIHPFFLNEDVSVACKKAGISVEAWCPLGGPQSGELLNGVIRDISNKYHRTEAQVVLRWHLQRGIIAIPKTARIERMRSNIDIFNFELSSNEIDCISALDMEGRLGAHPDTFTF